MLVASHQPNFMPYMGFFYKIYASDIFMLSDTVLFSSTGFHNYNFINANGEKRKLTIPVNKHMISIKDIKLSEWQKNRTKVWKTIKNAYSRSKYFKEYEEELSSIFEKDYEYMIELNVELIKFFCKHFKIDTPIKNESEYLEQTTNPNEDICKLCKDNNSNHYLSGNGAKVYIDEDIFKKNEVKIIWTNYKETVEGPLNSLSALDYLMNNGGEIPKEWEEMKQELRKGM